MNMLSEWKLWVLFAITMVICYLSLNFSWQISIGISLIVVLITKYLNERSVKKIWTDMIEDNYHIAKEYGYKTVSKTRDMGTPQYVLKKEIDCGNIQREDGLIEITMYIKFSGISVLYHLKDKNPLDKTASVHIISSNDWNLTAHDLEAIENHATGKSQFLPSLKN